ncbi:Uncharacterized membrane protein YdjX, TVP38/TMEM64 family, SNARE-associated domain [Evansella caseinilytica]|uniref:TVP38/TMEM64 family membrane protein n=1 Tax=Evansella caseinilytica TaxID=1503961 RepID=A0A1H3UBW2_9BACI|nr:VTT domain-containing protein [Evansella caseinilytica]SDZ59089.1 Uncharacterized membrane protein YdjX, TVP38/TMEM64 family, SNARE-associated domain [Evansella caseinilytica]
MELKKGILILISFVIVMYFLAESEMIQHLQQDDIYYFTDGLFQELGYGILFFTIPLMTIQGVITIFPVLVLILIHFISFGVVEGFLFSFVGATLGAIVCYWLTVSFSGNWVDKYWEKRQRTMNRLLRSIDKNGILIIVVLRSVPVMPSNLISIASALSPIRTKQYIFSTVWGNISMIWLLSLLSAPFWIADDFFVPYLVGYLVYAAAVILYYGLRSTDKQQADMEREKAHLT